MKPDQALALFVEALQKRRLKHYLDSRGTLHTDVGVFQVYTPTDEYGNVMHVTVQREEDEDSTHTLAVQEDDTCDFDFLVDLMVDPVKILLIEHLWAEGFKVDSYPFRVNGVFLPVSTVRTETFDKITLEDRGSTRDYYTMDNRVFDWGRILAHVTAYVQEKTQESASLEEGSARERFYEKALYRLEQKFGIEGHYFHPYRKDKLSYSEEGIHITLPNLDEATASKVLTLLRENNLL